MSQLITSQDKMKNVRGLLEKSKQSLAMALPRHITADRMLRIVLTSIQRTPELLECDPMTLLGAVFQSAQLGLEPDGVTGQAYLIPFYNGKKQRKEVQFIPGYRGLVSLARRSGQLSTISARVVHAKDRFSYAFGLVEKLEHIPSEDADPGPFTHAYAVARMKDGSVQWEIMAKTQIDAIRTRSKASSSGPWVNDYEEMAKKTVLRRLAKLLPVSVEMQTAITLDDHAEVGIPQELDALVIDPMPVDAEPAEAEVQPEPDLPRPPAAKPPAPSVAQMAQEQGPLPWEETAPSPAAAPAPAPTNGGAARKGVRL